MQTPTCITRIIKSFTTNTLRNGLQTSRKAILALNKSWTWRLRTRWRCYSTHTTHAFHTKFQHYNITHKATLAFIWHAISNSTKKLATNSIGLMIYVTIAHMEASIQRMHEQHRHQRHKFTKIAIDTQSNIPYWSSVNGDKLVTRLSNVARVRFVGTTTNCQGIEEEIGYYMICN